MDNDNERNATVLKTAIFTATVAAAVAAAVNLIGVMAELGLKGLDSQLLEFRYWLLLTHLRFAFALGAFATVAYVSFLLSLRPNPVVDVSKRNLAEEVRATLARTDPAASELLAKMEDHYRQSGEHRNDLILVPSTRSRHSFLLPRDAASLASAIERAVQKTASELAPSNFGTVLGFLSTMVLFGWLTLRTIFHDIEYHPLRMDFITFNTEIGAALIIADQLIKGMLVDFVEFFRIEILCNSIGRECYQLPYERVKSDSAVAVLAFIATATLLTLRTIPALVFFKGYQSYQQRVTVRRFLLHTVGRAEEEILRGRPSSPIATK